MKGWMDNEKGLLNILWERGFMDTSRDVCTYYTLRGQEDNCDKKNIEKSVRELMRNCLNFIEEEKIIKNNVCNMVKHRGHIIVDGTPKCQPDLSGEGIEYYWVRENNYYRKL